MELQSPDFEANGPIPRRYTCDGENIPPRLVWANTPEGVVELALTCEDPDAPRGTFVHWVAWKIDSSEAALPKEGVREGENDFGYLGYGGPCPPPGHGLHHYEFTLYALNDYLQLPQGADIGSLRQAMTGLVVDRAMIVGTYER